MDSLGNNIAQKTMSSPKNSRERRAPSAVRGPAPAPDAAILADFPVSAPQLAAQTGLSMEAIERTACAAFPLPESAQPWALHRHYGVLRFSAPAAEKILAAIEAGMSATPAPSASAPAFAPAPAEAPPAAALCPPRADLRVARVFPRSRNILALRANGLEVTLSVKSTDHLVPGMLLRDCVHEAYGWSYYGRLPRTSGERQHFMA